MVDSSIVEINNLTVRDMIVNLNGGIINILNSENVKFNKINLLNLEFD